MHVQNYIFSNGQRWMTLWLFWYKMEKVNQKLLSLLEREKELSEPFYFGNKSLSTLAGESVNCFLLHFSSPSQSRNPRRLTFFVFREHLRIMSWEWSARRPCAIEIISIFAVKEFKMANILNWANLRHVFFTYSFIYFSNVFLSWWLPTFLICVQLLISSRQTLLLNFNDMYPT